MLRKRLATAALLAGAAVLLSPATATAIPTGSAGTAGPTDPNTGAPSTAPDATGSSSSGSGINHFGEYAPIARLLGLI